MSRQLLRRDAGMPLLKEIGESTLPGPTQIYFALPGVPRRYSSRTIDTATLAGSLRNRRGRTIPARSDGAPRSSGERPAGVLPNRGPSRVPRIKASQPLILATALLSRNADSKDKPK
ncbi:hypothetical protein MRX96_055085 [Rhipicephalus microplus]